MPITIISTMIAHLVTRFPEQGFLAVSVLISSIPIRNIELIILEPSILDKLDQTVLLVTVNIPESIVITFSVRKLLNDELLDIPDIFGRPDTIVISLDQVQLFVITGQQVKQFFDLQPVDVLVIVTVQNQTSNPCNLLYILFGIYFHNIIATFVDQFVLDEQ